MGDFQKRISLGVKGGAQEGEKDSRHSLWSKSSQRGYKKLIGADLEGKNFVEKGHTRGI